MAEELEYELKLLLIDVLRLEEIGPDDIDPVAPLFGGGLGLDSLDALEIAMAISKRYGVSTGSDETKNRRTFANLRSLAQFVAANRPGHLGDANSSLGARA